MTIDNELSYKTYNGNGVTSEFAWPASLFEATSLAVDLITSDGTLVSQVMGADYGIDILDDFSAATVTGIIPDTGEILLLRRIEPFSQNTEYLVGGKFPAKAHERGLDRGPLRSARLLEEMETHLRIPRSWRYSGTSPVVTPGAFGYFRWNADATDIETVTEQPAIPIGNSYASYTSIVNMKADTDLALNMVVLTTGYYLAGDGGAGAYVIVAGGTGTDDGGQYHDLANGLQASLLADDTANVKHWGAVGDGSTDDTTFVQAAFDSGCSHVSIGDGSFAVSTITVPSTVRRITGPGTLKQLAQDDDILSVTSNWYGILIDGVQFEGAWSDGQSSQPGSSNNAIDCVDCVGVHVRNCSFTLIGFHSVWLRGCTDCTVTGNWFTEVGPTIYLQGSQRCVISNNTLNGAITDDTVFLIAISLESTDGHSYGYCRNVTVTDNHIYRFFNAQGIHLHAGIECNISNNTINGAVLPISLNPFNSGDFIQKVVISNNVVVCPDSLAGYTGGNDGIIVQGGGSTPDPEDIVIQGNTVSSANRAEQGNYQGGIRAGYTRRCSIIGNVITGAYGHGIVLTADEQDILIQGNTIRSVEAIGPTQIGILTRSAGPTGRIEGNIISDLNSGVGLGIDIESAGADLYLGSNTFRNVDNKVGGTDIGSCVAGTVLTVTAGTSVDLGGVDTVVFSHAAPTSVASWTNVIPNKLYTFIFTTANTTITRSAAFLDGSANIVGSADDVVIMAGRSGNTLRQASPLSVNG